MCEFLSHVEVEGKLFYLDDAALRDAFIRKALQGCKDNDLLGHGAIRQAFNIPQSKGINHENQDFWNTENFPEEIANKLRDFDNNFSEVFKLLQNDDLRYIIRYGIDEYNDKACKLLLENMPSSYDLCYIIRYGTDKYKDKAWKLLLENTPSNYNLHCILHYGIDKYKDKACKLLLENMPSSYDLCYIIRWGTEKYKEKAQTLRNERREQI